MAMRKHGRCVAHPVVGREVRLCVNKGPRTGPDRGLRKHLPPVSLMLFEPTPPQETQHAAVYLQLDRRNVRKQAVMAGSLWP